MNSSNASGRPGITLVQYPGVTRKGTLSAPCGKVQMTLGFKGLEYTIRNVSTPMQVKRFNPRGRVPAVIIDGETIVDSTDIISELDRRYPEPPLEPQGSKARARVKILEDWADEVLYFNTVYLRWCPPDNFRRMKENILCRLPIPTRWIAPIIARRTVKSRVMGQGVGLKGYDVVRRELRENLDAIVAWLDGKEFLVGDTFTRADLAVVALLDQLSLDQLTPDTAEDVAARPALIDYMQRAHRSVPDAARAGL